MTGHIVLHSTATTGVGGKNGVYSKPTIAANVKNSVTTALDCIGLYVYTLGNPVAPIQSQFSG